MNRESILIAIFILSFLSFAIYANAFTIQDLANSISQIFSPSQNSGTIGGFSFFQWAQNLFVPQVSTVPQAPTYDCCNILGNPCNSCYDFGCDKNFCYNCNPYNCNNQCLNQGNKLGGNCNGNQCDCTPNPITIAPPACTLDYCNSQCLYGASGCDTSGKCICNPKPAPQCSQPGCTNTCINEGYQVGTCDPTTGNCGCSMAPNTNTPSPTCTDNSKCNSDCRAKGYVSGYCASPTYCSCSYSTNSPTSIACDPAGCTSLCQSQGRTGGTCTSTGCSCSYSTTTFPNCDPSCCPDTNVCNSNCINSGRQYGLCTNGKCACSDTTIPPGPGCDATTCTNTCQYLGHSGGQCSNGYCQCSISLPTTTVTAGQICCCNTGSNCQTGCGIENGLNCTFSTEQSCLLSSCNAVAPGTNPCTQPGVCWTAAGTADPCDGSTGLVVGFCVDQSFYAAHTTWFQSLGGGTRYSCGKNYCLVANANNAGCWGTRGYCYISGGTGTGCLMVANPRTGDATGTVCQSHGGNVCSPNPTGNIVDQQNTYGPWYCSNTGQATASSSTTSSTTTTGTGGTTSSTSSTSSTSTTTTTPTIQPLAITCPTCFANTACSCSIPSNSCGLGGWIVQNLNNNPLPLINITTIPPYTVYFFPNQTGTVNVTTSCFDSANPRSNSTTVSVQQPLLVCPQTCAPNSQCSCTVNGCSSGLFLATSTLSNAVISVLPFTSNPYTATFNAPSSGSVNVVTTCDNPLLPSAKATIQIGTTTGTTSPTIPPGAFTHSNFRCLQVANKWTCTLNYNNQVGQVASLVYSIFSQNKYADAKSVTVGTGSGVSSPVIFDCGIEGSGTYSVSFKVYLTDLRNNAIDWSLSTEAQTISC